MWWVGRSHERTGPSKTAGGQFAALNRSQDRPAQMAIPPQGNLVFRNGWSLHEGVEPVSHDELHIEKE